MKIGDKICCKKTLSSDYKVYYTKNKIYYITDIDDFDIYIKSEDNTSIRFNTKQPNHDNFQIRDYFYTETDYRKAKLKTLFKINENRR
jgi:hypothetical protein